MELDIIECVPWKGFESSDNDTIYIKYLFIPPYTNPNPFRGTTDSINQ